MPDSKTRRRRRTRRSAPMKSSGEFAGHAKRQSLVTVMGHALSDDPRGEYEGRERNHYIVSTDRQPGPIWNHIIEYRGETWRIPGKVIDQIVRHRAAIATEIRTIEAQDRATERQTGRALGVGEEASDDE